MFYPSTLSLSACRQQLVYHDMHMQDLIPVYKAALVTSCQNNPVRMSSAVIIFSFTSQPTTPTIMLLHILPLVQYVATGMTQFFLSHILGLLENTTCK